MCKIDKIKKYKGEEKMKTLMEEKIDMCEVAKLMGVKDEEALKKIIDAPNYWDAVRAKNKAIMNADLSMY